MKREGGEEEEEDQLRSFLPLALFYFYFPERGNRVMRDDRTHVADERTGRRRTRRKVGVEREEMERAKVRKKAA